MFQPQPTPFAPFASYGIGPSLSSIPDFPAFQPVGGELIVDSGGPTLFRDPIFGPINPSANADVSGGALAFGGTYNKMAADDLDAQEALAREFQPSLEVCFASR
jgi:hypothetical protein